MREIVSIQVGQCGVNVGAKFFELVADEHGFRPDGMYNGDSDLQLERVDTYFAEGRGGNFVPRSVFVDLEPGPLEAIRGGSLGRARATTGRRATTRKGLTDLIDSVLDAVRKNAEGCEVLQGFQISHGLGGGPASSCYFPLPRSDSGRLVPTSSRPKKHHGRR